MCPDQIESQEREPFEPVGSRLALLICNGSFPAMPQLKIVGPAKDAELLKRVLSDPETCMFSVHALVDRGLLEVRREIARICASASEKDTLLIYYSGTGTLDKDESLYLPVADSEGEYLNATTLDTEFILSQLRASKCRRIILIIDACHSGAFFVNNRGIPDGLYAITACGANQTCSDTSEGGAFSLALCDGLRDTAADADGDGLVSIDELHEFVKKKLLADGYTEKPRKWVWNVPEHIFMTAVPRHVFLSYAREDSTEADRLAKALQTEGLSVWIDREDIRSGNWKDRIVAGLNHARAVVVLLTSAFYNSKAVRNELSFANNKSVPIIPVQLGEIPQDPAQEWFEFDYGELQRHIIDEKKYGEGVKKLASAIHSLRKTK